MSLAGKTTDQTEGRGHCSLLGSGGVEAFVKLLLLRTAPADSGAAAEEELKG